MDTELIHEFMRVVHDGNGYVLQVNVPEWESAYESNPAWHSAQHWKFKPSDRRLEAAKRKALDNRRFFVRCRACGERNNLCHTDEGNVCHSCSEKAGFVF